MHGRTAYKEIDSGRFSRLVKAGIAAVAIDLPGHGERLDERGSAASHTLDILGAVLPEIDLVIESLADPMWQNAFDLDRMGIGGMSLGGMATLRRLSDPAGHDFVCASVECSSGDLCALYDPQQGTHPWGLSASEAQTAPLDPRRFMQSFRPLPLLAMHSEADAIVPWDVQRRYLQDLKDHYRQQGADVDLVQWKTWPQTGAPQEHSGFGRVAAEAKAIQTAFFERWLLKR